MKIVLTAFIILFASGSSSGQKILSGEYDSQLKLAWDSTQNILTGYFESYSGVDENTGDAKFSCVFYIEGKVTGQLSDIKTYYPADKSDDLIEGLFEIVSNNSFKIKLSKEHGGCWNVLHFTDEPIEFKLEKRADWLQIRYVDIDTAFFHRDKFINTKMKPYLVQGNIVCIDKIEGEWAFCSFYGKEAIKGWIRIYDLNKF